MYVQSPKSEKGFTLVETLVAITILLLVITGPLTISMSSAKSTEFASEQVVAYFLAQEGAELAQKARDEILLEGLGEVTPANWWDDFADHVSAGAYLSNCYSLSGCGLEVGGGAAAALIVEDCSVSGACQLYYDSGAVRSRYTHNSLGTTKTPYTRTIYFEKGASDFDVKVTSKVTWRTGNLRKTQEIEVETFLFDIYDN